MVNNNLTLTVTLILFSEKKDLEYNAITCIEKYTYMRDEYKSIYVQKIYFW